jgi:hypothetical protein
MGGRAMGGTIQRARLVRLVMAASAGLLGVTGLVSMVGAVAAGAATAGKVHNPPPAVGGAQASVRPGATTSDSQSVSDSPGNVYYVYSTSSNPQAPPAGPSYDAADLINATATDDGTTLTFTAQTVASKAGGYNPQSDPNWMNDTYIGWQLSTVQTGGVFSTIPSYDVYFQLNSSGQLAGEMTNESTDTPVSCAVTLSYNETTGTFTASAAAACIGGATSFAWNVYSNYDTVSLSSDPTGQKAFGKSLPDIHDGGSQYAPTVTAPSVAVAASSSPAYWLFGRDGGAFAFGGAPYYGSVPGDGIAVDDIVNGVSTVDHKGYWMVGSDGGVFSFGDALFYGSMGGKRLVAPVVAIAADSNGAGYWEVASDGGVFSFGGAQFYGSMGGKQLVAPVVGMASTPDGGGYWLFAQDGGVFAFGDAGFFQSMGGKHLNAPMVAGVPSPDGNGYWLVAADGGVFAFGDALFDGSMGGIRLVGPMLGIVPTPDGNGYWTVAADGGVFAFGDAPFFGSLGGTPRTDPIVALAMALT